jgi:hypothetical protein
LLPVAQELRPGFVGFADEDDVGKTIQRLFLHRGEGSANDGHHAA